MKLFIKIIAFLAGFLVIGVLVIGGLGYSAVRYNFWPPFCEVLTPIKQARRVCEFSKLEKAKEGAPTQVTFNVTVDPETKDEDGIFLVLRDKQSIKMDKIAEFTYQTKIDAKVGEEINYSYYKNYDEPRSNMISGEFGFNLKSLNKVVYDAVPLRTYFGRNYILPTRNIHMMFDTWSINYNFNFFENTKWNIESSMKRAKALGANQFDVYSFMEVLGDKKSFVVQEIPTPYKYHRDAAITEKDMLELVRLGKKYELDVVIHYNTQADYSKYFSFKDIGLLGQGKKGASSHERAANELGVYDEVKSREWVKMWFDGLEKTMLDWAGRAERTGIYGLDITPQYMVPKMSPEENYADERYAQMITNIRKIYQGKIFGSNSAWYGGMPSRTPQYINTLDGLYAYLPGINVPSGSDVETMRKFESGQMDQVENDLKNYKQEVYLVMTQGSYEGVNNGKKPFEFNDYAEEQAIGSKADWQAQADGYEAFFQALNKRKFFKGVAHSGYWWDDLMDPNYADPLISMHFSIRNKPAEAVWKKWMKN